MPRSSFGASIGLHKLHVSTNLKSSEHPSRVSWKLKYGINSLGAEASADNLPGSSHGRFGCVASSPSTQSPKSEYPIRPTFSRFRLYNPSGVPLPAVNAHTGQFIVGKRWCLNAPILSSVLVPTPVFISATNSVLRTSLLGGRGRRGGFTSSRPR